MAMPERAVGRSCAVMRRVVFEAPRLEGENVSKLLFLQVLDKVEVLPAVLVVVVDLRQPLVAQAPDAARHDYIVIMLFARWPGAGWG